MTMLFDIIVKNISLAILFFLFKQKSPFTILLLTFFVVAHNSDNVAVNLYSLDNSLHFQIMNQAIEVVPRMLLS